MKGDKNSRAWNAWEVIKWAALVLVLAALAYVVESFHNTLRGRDKLFAELKAQHEETQRAVEARCGR